MATINLSAPNGWNRWIYARTTAPDVTYLPDAPFPIVYTPAKSAWVKGEIDTCSISWPNPMDYLSTVVASGGTTSLTGLMSGMATAEILKNIPDTGTFSAFGQYPGPRFGFCIGDNFKQQVYVRFDVFNIRGATVLLTNSELEMVENSKFKRVYVNHGEIANYSTSGGKFVLTLDINKFTPPPSNINISGTTLKVIKSDGKTFNCTVRSINDSWGFVIDDPGSENVPSSGDFYELNTVLCIEDPYLISGFWRGTEDSVGGNTSGLNLYVTEHNSPFQESQFTGVYLYENNTTGQVISSTVGSNTRDVGDDTWAFLSFQNSNLSSSYDSDVRYREVILTAPDSENSTISFVPRNVATAQDYSNCISNNTTSFIRTEIATGGYFTRQNWHSPCLKGCYVKNGGKLFKILAHVESDVIDVNIKSIDGTTSFDPYANKDYSIINQSAWIINESYFTDPNYSSGNVFRGAIKSVSGNAVDISANKLTLTIVKDFEDMGKPKYGLSFSQRYKTDVTLPSNYKKGYSKNQDWVLVSGGKGYRVSSVVFSDPNKSENYTIDFKLSEDVSNLAINDTAFVTFDIPYHSTSGAYSAIASSNLVLDMKPSLKEQSPFLVSDSLCLSGEYNSPPYAIDIPIDTRIGVGDCQYFGIDANGTATQRRGAVIFATTQGAARGLASLFHTLRQEGWIAYQDPVTQRMTVRRGSCDFTEYPTKNMVVLGNNLYRENVSGGSAIQLDDTKDWLRRIQYDTPSSPQHGITFAFGSANNTYGFYVSGQGIVNLGLLSVQGQAAGNVSSSAYTSTENYPVSPVYAYTKEYYQALDQYIVDIGIKASDGPLYVKNAAISNVITEYVDDNQTIGDVGYFDIIRMPYGEIMLLYGQKVEKFTVNDTPNDPSTWHNPNAIMIAGTYDDSYYWSSPLAGRTDDTEQQNQYPMMLLNSVNYLCSSFYQRNNTLNVFCRCNTGGEDFVGCYSVSVCELRKNIYLCTSTDDVQVNFLERHPAFDDSFINDKTKSWTDSFLQDTKPYDSTKENLSDKFVRVIGPASTNPQVKYAKELGIISTSILPSGSMIVFYDGDGGIQCLFSDDCGRTWASSKLIYGRNGRAGVLVGHYLFYVVSSGIQIKVTNFTDFSAGMRYISQNNEGKDTTAEELSTQAILDGEETFLIGSGVVDPQRLSGYITQDGTIKVFFYDQNNLLKCMSSSDAHVWKVADNF